MFPRGLRWLRLGVAVSVGAALTAALVDFRGLVPWRVGQVLAKIQFVPSLMALLSGASLSLACLVIVVVTLLAGRLYCSVVCPLGLLQDVLIGVAQRLKPRSGPAPFARAHPWWQQVFLWVTVGAAVAGFGGWALSWLDPYSNFSRIASDLFRPLLTVANNLIGRVTDRLGWGWLFHVQPHWAPLGALVLPVSMLVLLGVLAAWRGRLYCNTVCPVGTVLGWLAKRAVFRLQIDANACRKCAACLRACKAQCLDLRLGRIDFSRCVACYNCVGVCEEGAIGYHRASGRRKLTAPCASPATPDAVANPHRRAFLSRVALGVLGAAGLGGTPPADLGRRDQPRGATPAAGPAGNTSPAICPPGSSGVAHFLDCCTACHLCISACPTSVLQPAVFEFGWAGLLKPRLDYHVAFCNYDCRRCGEVCPVGAIAVLTPGAKHLTKIGQTQFDREKCVVVTNGTDCAACSEHCPTKAVSTVPYTKNGNKLRLPSVNQDFCIGCGACEYACPAKPDKAINVTGLREHGWARKNIEPKATLPRPGGDFPF